MSAFRVIHVTTDAVEAADVVAMLEFGDVLATVVAPVLDGVGLVFLVATDNAEFDLCYQSIDGGLVSTTDVATTEVLQGCWTREQLNGIVAALRN